MLRIFTNAAPARGSVSDQPPPTSVTFFQPSLTFQVSTFKIETGYEPGTDVSESKLNQFKTCFKIRLNSTGSELVNCNPNQFDSVLHCDDCLAEPISAQQILSRFCPKSPSIPIVKHSFSLKFHSLPSSSSYLSIQSQNLEFPSGAFHPTSTAHKEACSSSRRRIWCSGSNSTAEAKEGHEVRSRVTVRKKKLAVFVSGGGSNFRSIHEASKWGSLHGDVHVLVTNKSECGGAEYARNNGIPVILFPKAKDESNGLSPNDLVNTLRRFEVDFILLAGYLKLIPVELIRAYERSI
ncbi:hypothetical protein RJT34_12531 [Clitoria ternatea]|uniref:phosphoribosylglycinamide formyltransferase 1 n=1 Tax=Clitoria ternatea TaxID=43366 RepID=A0AAN9JNY2_CLITE